MILFSGQKKIIELLRWQRKLFSPNLVSSKVGVFTNCQKKVNQVSKKTKQKTQTFFICVWKWVIRVTSFPLGWPWAFRSPGTWGPIGRSRSSGKPCPLWSTRHHYWLVCVIGVGDIMCSVWMYVMHALASVCVWERVCNFLFVSVSLISSVNRTQLCALKIRCEIPQTDSHYCFQNCMP